MQRKVILITIGDPNGLGPELVCRLCSEQPGGWKDSALLILAPSGVLESYGRDLDLPCFWHDLADQALSARDLLTEVSCEPARTYLYALPDLQGFDLTPGQATVSGGLVAGRCLDLACTMLRQGLAQALVTCPLNKKMLNQAGFHFSGHTEFLAQRFGLGADEVCMHLFGPRLRVSLVTTHPPLRAVPDLLSESRIVHCLHLTWDLLNRLALAVKPIAVCGLNPHAGEGGTIGLEDEQVILPAVRTAREQGIMAQGPLPADTVFYRALQGEFSAVLAMYHDQGLGPLKSVHFQEAVNVTLGLPVIRTSVDHGTGYDLVGQGKASTESLRQAIDLAWQLV